MSNLATSYLIFSPNQSKISLKVILMSKIVAFIFLQFLLYSCATESNIMDGSQYSIREKDKKFRLDSFKVVNIIDNRKVKNLDFGYSGNDNNYLTLNRPLPDYLRMMFNVLISSDSSQKHYVPVTVYVDEFSLQINYNSWGNTLNHKFSYLFEYPYNSGTKSIRILDSVTFNEDAAYKNQRELIISSLRETSKSIALNIGKNLYPESNQSHTADSAIKIKIIDTIRLKPFKIVGNKVGVLINSFKGSNSSNGILISYINMFNYPNSKTETGIGLGFEYFENTNSKGINNNYNYEKYSSYGLALPIIGRYNLSSNLNNLFLNGVFTITVGVEQTNDNQSILNFGARLEESIGFYLFKYIALNGGIYQQGKSKYFDSGFFLSIGVTGGY